MKFCPQCGKELSVQNSKFCGECGASLTSIESPQSAPSAATYARVESPTTSVVTSLSDDDEVTTVKLNVYDLGIKLEETTAAIFEKMGYSVERRQKPVTQSEAFTTEFRILN